MTALRVLIADDELMARRRLRRLLDAIPEVTVAGECLDGAQVLAWLGEQEPVHVVLLDIKMPRLSGVEAMRLWPEGGPAIIFTTAHAEHAVAAFEGRAAHYLLKPIEAGQLAEALQRVRPTASTPQRLALRTRKGVVLLRPGEVLCAQVQGASVRVATDRGELFTERSLSELQTQLGQDFERVHRKALVNMSRVAALEDLDSGGYEAVLDDGRRVVTSRGFGRKLRRRLGV